MPRPAPRSERSPYGRIALASVALTLAVAAVAGAVRLGRDRNADARPPGAPGVAGWRVAIDPETGELGMPGAEPAVALETDLASMLSRSDEGLEVVVHPDGRKSVDLQGRFMDMTVVHRDADGTLRATCTHDLTTAQKALAGCDGHAHASPEVK